MTSKERLTRDLEIVQRALDVEDSDVSMELDWDRVPEDAKVRMEKASEIHWQIREVKRVFRGKTRSNKSSRDNCH